MKKYIMILCAALGITSCINDMDTVITGAEQFTAEYVGEPNTTIAEVRSQFQSQITSGVATAAAQVTENLIVEGIVTGNDISGNIYQAIFIQGINNDGTLDTQHGGLQIAIKGIGSLAAVFPVGQKVRINLNGLYVSGYGQMVKIGQPYITASSTSPSVRVGPMDQLRAQKCIQLVGKPYNNIVTPHEFTSADMKSIDALTPLFVVIHNCKIKSADGITPYAKKESSETYSVSHDIELSDGKTVTLYNSTSSNFAADVMPEGKLTIYGIMTRYNNYWQLILRSVDDVVVEK